MVSNFVQESCVFTNQHLDTRNEVLRFISDKASELGITNDANATYEAFQYRESLDCTGMVEGFAIPHAKTDAIGQAAVIVLKNDHRIAWPSFDEEDCDVFIALLVPESEAGTTHLKLLSKTAVLLTKEDFRARMRQSDDPHTIVEMINENLGDE